MENKIIRKLLKENGIGNKENLKKSSITMPASQFMNFNDSIPSNPNRNLNDLNSLEEAEIPLLSEILLSDDFNSIFFFVVFILLKCQLMILGLVGKKV